MKAVPSGKAVSVQDLYFRYPDYPEIRFPALFENMSFSLNSGQTGLFLGAPETGKTTLSRILTGLVPRYTGGDLKGELLLGGRKLSKYKPYELMEQVGLVFQNPDEQIITTRCDTEVAFALESLGLPRREIEVRVERCLDLLQMAHYRERNPATLSEGEKRRLLFACLCAVDPEVFILDEALEEIDPPTRRRLLGYLDERGKTVLLFSSKWLDAYSGFVDRVFLLTGKSCIRNKTSSPSKAFLAECYNTGVILPPEIRFPLYRDGASVRHPTKPHSDAEVPAGRDRHGQVSLDKIPPTLLAEDLSFRYSDNTQFSLQIDRVDIEREEIVSVIGRNGSGKSTLGRILSGLLEPASGSVSIASRGTLTQASTRELNRRVAYMFQNPDLQIFLPTVREELAFGLKHLGAHQKEIDGSISEVIELFELPGPEVPPSLMSYGTRKRLQAAIYYLLERPLLILDEADSGLSLKNFINLIELFVQQRRSIMFITHDVSLAAGISNRILLMENGKIRTEATRDDFSKIISRLDASTEL